LIIISDSFLGFVLLGRIFSAGFPSVIIFPKLAQSAWGRIEVAAHASLVASGRVERHSRFCLGKAAGCSGAFFVAPDVLMEFSIHRAPGRAISLNTV
jgi:hypothetical protein